MKCEVDIRDAQGRLQEHLEAAWCLWSRKRMVKLLISVCKSYLTDDNHLVRLLGTRDDHTVFSIDVWTYPDGDAGYRLFDLNIYGGRYIRKWSGNVPLEVM